MCRSRLVACPIRCFSPPSAREPLKPLGASSPAALSIYELDLDVGDTIAIVNRGPTRADQLASVKAALNGLSLEMVESFALYCLQNPEQFDGSDDAVRQAVKALALALRPIWTRHSTA